MRILLAVLLVAFTALIGASRPARRIFPTIPRRFPRSTTACRAGSICAAALAVTRFWTQEHISICGCSSTPTAAATATRSAPASVTNSATGLRFDGTVDYLANDGLTDGTYTLHLSGPSLSPTSTTIFPLSGSRLGRWRLRRLCRRRRWCGVLSDPCHRRRRPCRRWSAGPRPLAAMAGVTYDAGSWVADLGYRLIYCRRSATTSPAARST